MKRVFLALATAGFLAASVPATASETTRTPSETLGYLEWIVLQDSGLRLKARLDTGAKTSSLHAVNVEPFARNGEKWVRFQIPLEDHKDQGQEEPGNEAIDEQIVLEFERPVERTVLVKRKGVESQRRYVVIMPFCIGGSEHQTEFSLTDRSRFNYPALLGRRFMRDDRILVDSSSPYLAQKECEHMSLEELSRLNAEGKSESGEEKH